MTLTEALGIRPGVTALVGAGGKTSTMLQLARELRSAGQTVAVTTTTHIFPPPADLCGAPLYSPNHEELAAAAERSICAVGRELDAKGKMTGLDDAGIEALAQHFSYVLTEADGSRRMPCKVPADHEPVIPASAETVVGVLGLSALGKPLCEVCFRAELAAQRLGVLPSDSLSPALLARIACGEDGLRRQVGDRRFVLLLNQAEVCPMEAAETVRLCRAQRPELDIVTASLQQEQWTLWRGEKDLCSF